MKASAVCLCRNKKTYLINGADMCPTCPDGVHVPAGGCGKLDQTGAYYLDDVGSSMNPTSDGKPSPWSGVNGAAEMAPFIDPTSYN